MHNRESGLSAPRFISLREGNLVYYKTEGETEYGCRGAVSIGKAEVRAHELDDLRFDVSVNDCVWYLRAASVEDRQKWVDGIERYKYVLQQQLQYNSGSDLGHRRQGSNISLSSNTLSTGSRIGGGKGKGLTEKLAEIETFRDILCRQIDTLQGYFDSFAANSMTIDRPAETQASVGEVMYLQKQGIDFKGEAITFKATTAGILATLSHCIEVRCRHRKIGMAWRGQKPKKWSIVRTRREGPATDSAGGQSFPP